MPLPTDDGSLGPDVGSGRPLPRRSVRSTGRPWLDRAIVASALFVGLPLVGLAGMVVADNVPDRWVMDRLFEGVSTGSLDAEDYGVGIAGGRVDEFTECIAITVLVGDADGVGTLESAIRAPTLGKCSEAVPRIVGWAEGEGLRRNYDYYRYWHGHGLVLRPSVALFGVAATRLLAAAALVVSVLALARATSRRLGLPAAVALVGPLVASTDFVDLPSVLPHALSMTLLLGTAAFVVDRPPRSTWALLAVAAASGAAFVYVDLFPLPSAAWTMFVVAAGIGAVALPAAPLLGRMALAGGGWILGYAWMWFTKWVFAAMVVGVDTVRSVIRYQIELRLDGEQASVEDRVFASIERNVEEWWNQPLTWLVAATAVVAVAASVIRIRRSGASGEWPVRAVLALPAAIPFVWYEVLSNHSQVHAWLTYRSVAVALGVVVMAATARRPAEAVRDTGPEGRAAHEAGRVA